MLHEYGILPMQLPLTFQFLLSDFKLVHICGHSDNMHLATSSTIGVAGNKYSSVFDINNGVIHNEESLIHAKVAQ